MSYSSTPPTEADDLLARRGRPGKPNPLDVLVDNLADWILEISEEMADAIAGGMNAPFAEAVSEREKLAYYSRQMFNPDGTPNTVGRDQEAARLGIDGFAEVLDEVLKAHPEWRRRSENSVPLPVGPLAPDGLPTHDSREAAGNQQGRTSVPMPSGPIAPDGLPTRA